MRPSYIQLFIFFIVDYQMRMPESIKANKQIGY